MSQESALGIPELKVVRRQNKLSSAIVFIHGFTGTADTTWGTFISTLLQDSRLGEWDIYSIGYSSRLTVDVPIWATDPKLEMCALGFRTKLRHAPLGKYRAIAVVAHSMGGLVVQRAIVDNPEIRRRVSHVVLYGCPSNGLKKARFWGRLKRQLADMAEGGRFVESLRRTWDRTFEGELPFVFRTVAGSEDSFVSPESSLMPFPDPYREVVPGDHTGIVQPEAVGDLSYAVFYKALTRSGALRSTLESARLAVETNDYGSVVEALLPLARNLDDDAVVTLALALESLGRHDEATQGSWRTHFEQGVATLDAAGVLAGRLKRRWLFSRMEADYNRSLSLYEEALERAVVLGRARASLLPRDQRRVPEADAWA